MKRWKHDSVLHVPEYADETVHVGRKVPKILVLENIGRTCLKVLKASKCMVAYDEQDERHFIALGMTADEISRISHLPEGIGLLGLLWGKEQGTIRLDHITAHPKSSGCPLGHTPIEAFLGTPIRFDQEVLGVIYLTRLPGDDPFSVEDENTLEVLASACAIELATAQTFEQLKRAYNDLESRTQELDRVNQQLRMHENELETSSQELIRANSKLQRRDAELEARTVELDRANKQLNMHAIDLELINEELTAANRAKDQFLANTSHELRTPLNAIIGFSELLVDKRLGELSDKQHRYVDHINASGKRLLEIINALLDISKIESGMMEIHEVVFDPAEVGRQLISSLMPLAQSKQIELLFHAPKEIGISIQSDRDKVHQILTNLVGNAIKFTPDHGRVELDMNVAVDDRHDTCLYCRIKDDGIGIAEADQQKIFKPFEQASHGMARSHGGTGLGLSLSKHMAELMGGTIRLESQLGKGSSFTVELPVSVDHNEYSAMSETGRVLRNISEETGISIGIEAEPLLSSQATILIVDEQLDRAHAAQDTFMHEGYQVVLAAMDDLTEADFSMRPFLVVLGVPADGKDMYERLHRLKRIETANSTPTILLAGDADHLNFTTGGAIGQIANGLERDDLLEMVSHLDVHSPMPVAPTVLVVDDELSVRDYLKETLTTEGYRVLLASNGSEGICLAIERDPDLIILDLMMPGITGFEVIQRLKKHPTACDIPVVVFSAKDLSRGEALLLGQDVERILVKGTSNRSDVLHQLHKLELLYPVRAKLMDTKLDCFNLRYMQRRLDHEISRALRYHHSFSVLAWRMDGFDKYCKKYGDRWGLAALKASVSILHVIIRKADVVARLDHDCLMLLLPGLSQQGCYSVAEKIRLRISHQHLPLPNQQKGHLTVSIGGVSSDACKDREEMMVLIRQRMDMAVEEGGNRVVMEG